MAELTVIIPFCNEGDEVLKTCESCLEFAMGPIEFILIDDNSVDGYNYISVAKRNNATLITHSKQLGVSPSRNDGVELCKTPYFLFLDAHMSQTRKGWDLMCVDLMRKNPKSLICSNTGILSADRKTCQVTTAIGATINERWRHEWAYDNDNELGNIVEIPCVLGAAYLTSKTWWKYIHGLDGLRGFGVDEEFMSTKTWLAGGSCLCVKDWICGHIYNVHRPHPYTSTKCVTLTDEWYNRFTALTILYSPEEREAYIQRILDFMDTTEDGRKQKENFKALWNGLKANKDWINFVSREKEYMNKIRKK